MARRIVAALALLLYLTSLVLPAFDLEQGNDGYYVGFVVVLFGALSFDPRWLANPLWLIGVVGLFTKYRLAALIALAIATLLALLCLNYVGTEIAQNESGVKTTVLAMGWGYYIWFSSILVPALYAIYTYFGKREAITQHPQSDDGTQPIEGEQ